MRFNIQETFYLPDTVDNITQLLCYAKKKRKDRYTLYSFFENVDASDDVNAPIICIIHTVQLFEDCGQKSLRVLQEISTDFV